MNGIKQETHQLEVLLFSGGIQWDFRSVTLNDIYYAVASFSKFDFFFFC